jgi:mono/diheme cytochrome c family protein
MPTRHPVSKAVLLLAAVVMSGCVSIEQIAPPVATFAAPPSGAQRTQLEQGRTIYLTKCAKCHQPEPVHRYAPARWEDILAEMIGETKLDAAESAAVRAYVFAALRQ